MDNDVWKGTNHPSRQLNFFWIVTFTVVLAVHAPILQFWLQMHCESSRHSPLMNADRKEVAIHIQESGYRYPYRVANTRIGAPRDFTYWHVRTTPDQPQLDWLAAHSHGCR